MPDLSRFPVAPSGAVEEDTGETIGARSAPSWDSVSRAATLRAATRVMQAFARPRMPESLWWADLEPLLSPQAQLDYAGTDPTNVLASRITGPAHVAQVHSTRLVRVQVPTNAGMYTVVLSRRDGASPWLAERLSPPERRRG